MVDIRLAGGDRSIPDLMRDRQYQPERGNPCVSLRIRPNPQFCLKRYPEKATWSILISYLGLRMLTRDSSFGFSPINLWALTTQIKRESVPPTAPETG